MAIKKTTSYKRNNKDSGQKIALNSVPDNTVVYSSELGSGEYHMKYDSVSHHSANRSGNYHCRGKKQFQTKEDFIRKKKNIHSFLRGNIQPTEECRFITPKALDAKDKQIDELNNRLRESHQLQLGLQEKLKMLPGPDKQLVDGETTDTSNTTAKEEKENVNKQKSLKKGLWQRLFG